jgi:glycosyltransferase involved in cell wall biosynthesis
MSSQINRPHLSVITPVYNGKRFIESCLQSVISQNCAQAEHLVIDGASSDGTVEIIERYARQYPHIRWISEKDRGQSSAMNKGIAMSQGKIIGILNVDDYYEPALLPRVLKIFETLPTPSFLSGNCRVYKDDGSLWYINKPRLNVSDILIGGENNQFPHNPASYFYHKSLHDKIGLFDEADHYAMDVDFVMRAISTAHPHYVDEIWGNYRFLKGTKTYVAKENNQLQSNKMRVMDLYLKKLPLIEQWRIKAMRYIFIQRRPQYYANKVKGWLKSPRLSGS